MSLDFQTRTFEAQRGVLVGLAYRLTSSRTEAEDVVQDAFLRWRKVDPTSIDDPHAYLATIVTRLCLDRMKSARARREIYVGPWLPEPLVDETLDGGGGELSADLSMALMLALERLSPLERAAFILHDVFDLDFAEVARGVGRSEEACRQLASRARAHLRQGRPRYAVSPEEGVRVAEAFEAAVRSGDATGLKTLLANDAVLLSDGGGKRAAALNPIRGADAIIRFMTSFVRKNAIMPLTRMARVNGAPGFVLDDPEGGHSVVSLEINAGRIAAIYFVRNPDKLAHVTS